MGEERQVTWLSLSVCWGMRPEDPVFGGGGTGGVPGKSMQRELGIESGRWRNCREREPGLGRGTVVLVMCLCVCAGSGGWPREQWEKPLGCEPSLDSEGPCRGTRLVWVQPRVDE